MATIKEIRTILQEYHAAIPGVVRSFLYPPRKIETAMMPCVLLRTGGGEWEPETTSACLQTRTFITECIVHPLPQNQFEVQEERIDDLIQAFGEFYCRHRQIGMGTWIASAPTIDQGWQVLDFGILYIGFTFEIQVETRNSCG